MTGNSCTMLRLGVALTAAALAGADVHDVRAYGATGDGSTYDTLAVRAAAAAVTKAGRGTLLFPAGRYLTGAFNISSNTHVEITPGATVLGSTRGADWPVQHCHDLGTFSMLSPRLE